MKNKTCLGFLNFACDLANGSTYHHQNQYENVNPDAATYGWKTSQTNSLKMNILCGYPLTLKLTQRRRKKDKTNGLPGHFCLSTAAVDSRLKA